MDKKIGTVVGVEEIASILHYMGESVDESVTVNFTDNKYGWKDLSSASVSRVRDGYLLNLPRTVLLD